MTKTPKDFDACLKERLELPRAILIQLRETRLFNSMLEEAIEDIDAILNQRRDQMERSSTILPPT